MNTFVSQSTGDPARSRANGGRTRASGSRWLPLLLLAAWWLVIGLLHAFDDDEFQHVHHAWLIASGQWPFVDFFEHHLPVYHALLAPLFLSGEGWQWIFAFRAIGLLSAAGVVVLTYRMALRTGCRSGHALAVVVLLSAAPMFVLKMTEARPAAPATVCLVAALAVVVISPERLRNANMSFVTGLLLGLGVALSNKYVFAGTGIVAGVAVAVGLRPLVYLAAGAVLPGAVVAAVYALGGHADALVESVIVRNLRWGYTFAPTGYLYKLFDTAGLLLVLGVAGVLRLLAVAPRRSAVLLACLGGGVVGVFAVPVPYRQTFLPLFPVLAVGAAHLLRAAWDSVPEGRAKRSGYMVLIGTAVVAGLMSLYRSETEAVRSDLRTMRAVTAVDPTRGPVFDGRGLMFWRPHIGRYACMHHGILSSIDAEAYARETIAALKTANYPTVIDDYRVAELPEAIRRFIHDHYVALDDSAIRVPGVAVDRARLSPHGSDVQLPVGGVYRVSWTGGNLTIDGTAIASGSTLALGAGPHRVAAEGFVEELRLVLVKRGEADAR